jgi:hypothetical protein
MELFESGRCLCDRTPKGRDNLRVGRDEISQNVSMHRWLGTHHELCVGLATVSVAHELCDKLPTGIEVDKHRSYSCVLGGTNLPTRDVDGISLCGAMSHNQRSRTDGKTIGRWCGSDSSRCYMPSGRRMTLSHRSLTRTLSARKVTGSRTSD